MASGKYVSEGRTVISAAQAERCGIRVQWNKSNLGNVTKWISTNKADLKENDVRNESCFLRMIDATRDSSEI